MPGPEISDGLKINQIKWRWIKLVQTFKRLQAPNKRCNGFKGSAIKLNNLWMQVKASFPQSIVFRAIACINGTSGLGGMFFSFNLWKCDPLTQLSGHEADNLFKSVPLFPVFNNDWMKVGFWKHNRFWVYFFFPVFLNCLFLLVCLVLVWWKLLFRSLFFGFLYFCL